MWAKLHSSPYQRSTHHVKHYCKVDDEVTEVTYKSIRRNQRTGTFTGELLYPSKLMTKSVKIEGRVDCEMGGRNRTITIFGESDVKVSEKALKQILWQFGIECHGYVPVRKNVYSMAV